MSDGSLVGGRFGKIFMDGSLMKESRYPRDLVDYYGLFLDVLVGYKLIFILGLFLG